MKITEGKAEFILGNAFYRTSSKLSRDLGVLAAAVYRQEKGELKVLDAMSGCGVRSLRYYLESQADQIWANEANPDIQGVLGSNLTGVIPDSALKITCSDAQTLLLHCSWKQDYYDLVDVDSFGSPHPYLQTSFWGTKKGGLMYLTSTDGRTATGHLPEHSLAVYGAYSRSHPASREQGLRLLLGTLQQQAAHWGNQIEPIFSLFHGQIYRVMVRLLPRVNLSSTNYGFIGYCHHCGEYQSISWRGLGKVRCDCAQPLVVVSGPMWLGNLHQATYLEKMAALATTWAWTSVVELLQVMIAETDYPPYFYTLAEIGRRGKLDLKSRSLILSALHHQGYRATVTHVDPTGIKTNATLQTCINLAPK